jgi:signal transduction histidine kinase
VINCDLLVCCQRLTSQAEQAKMAFETERSPAPIVIHADASQILPAMGNLVDNAFKFTPPNATVGVALT